MIVQKRLQQYFNNVIERHRLSHAYLLVGENGIGKNELATWIAKKVFCEQPNSPCLNCQYCHRIEQGETPNVTRIKPNGQFIKVEDVRQIKSDSAFSSLENKTKIYIIEQADKMSVSAANGLLKMIEDPIDNHYYILLSEQQELILPTVLSRLQVIKCDRIQSEVFEQRLIQKQMSPIVSYVLSHITRSENEVNRLVEKDFSAFCDNVLQWCKMLMKNDNKSFLFVQRTLQTYLSDRELAMLGLDIVTLYFSDMIKAKRTAYQSPIIMKRDVVQYSVKNTSVEHAMTAKQKIKSYVSAQSSYEWLVLQMKK